MKLIYDDIITYICQYLDDKNKIQFLSTTININKLKHKIFFNELVIIDRISQLPYFDRFTEIIIIFDIGKIPKYIKKLYFGNFIDRHITNKIPLIWRNVKSNSDFNDLIQRDLPTTLTHMEFGTYFNDKINFRMPSSITHVTFGYCFNQPINICLPEFIIELTCSYYFDCPIYDLPASLICINLHILYLNEIEPILLPIVNYI